MPAGAFDETLKKCAPHYQDIMDIMLPTLGKERQATYSPVLPVSQKVGRRASGAGDGGRCRRRPGWSFEDEGERVTQSILGGQAKLQWKVDWAMRWVALGVDYEMSGKDLIDSGYAKSGKITRSLGRAPARGFQLRDVPRRKGREDFEVEGQWPGARGQWLTYGTDESLAFYIFREPRKR